MFISPEIKKLKEMILDDSVKWEYSYVLGIGQTNNGIWVSNGVSFYKIYGKYEDEFSLIEKFYLHSAIKYRMRKIVMKKVFNIEQKGKELIKHYKHHDVWVAVQSDLKGKHWEHCLCNICAIFNPGVPEQNCKIANMLYAVCLLTNIVSPVYECPQFKEKEINFPKVNIYEED